MPNPSSSVTFSRRASLGVAIKPVFRGRKASARSGVCKLRRCEPNDLVKTRGEAPGTEAFQEMFVVSRQQFVAMAYSVVQNTEDAEDAVQNAFICLHFWVFAFAQFPGPIFAQDLVHTGGVECGSNDPAKTKTHSPRISAGMRGREEQQVDGRTSVA